MSLLTGPTRWLVRVVMWFPDGFRPGLFVFVLLVLFWLVTTRTRLLWDALCRGVGVGVDTALGCLLFPEYVITSARRSQGQAPGTVTRVTGDVFERLLDGAATLYARHGPPLPSSPPGVGRAVGAAAAAPAPPGAAPAAYPPPGSAPVSPARPGGTKPVFPWGWATVVLVVPLALWLVGDQAPTSPMADWVDRAWAYWMDLERWARR